MHATVCCDQKPMSWAAPKQSNFFFTWAAQKGREDGENKHQPGAQRYEGKDDAVNQLSAKTRKLHSMCHHQILVERDGRVFDSIPQPHLHLLYNVSILVLTRIDIAMEGGCELCKKSNDHFSEADLGVREMLLEKLWIPSRQDVALQLGRRH